MIAIGKHLGLQPAMIRRFICSVIEKKGKHGLEFSGHKAHNLEMAKLGEIGDRVWQIYLSFYFAISMRPLDLLKRSKSCFFPTPVLPISHRRRI